MLIWRAVQKSICPEKSTRYFVKNTLGKYQRYCQPELKTLQACQKEGYLQFGGSQVAHSTEILIST